MYWVHRAESPSSDRILIKRRFFRSPAGLNDISKESVFVAKVDSQITMLLQRSRWLLPALIVPWLNLLQLGAALPAHDERSHVSASTLDPSAATSAIIREGYNKRAHPPADKNATQPGHKLVASPAGLLRPDKFQFYTYNDKGDMITRQMTVQEIQGLIAAGGADHVAMDRQEPQKANDVLTGGKKVMDVVQKVQNVLKSALDKPPTLTGSIPKIPEHANVEWSNILPSILSGEADTSLPSSSESNQLSHKLTTKRPQAGNGVVVSSTENSPNTGTTSSTKKKPVMSDGQTNMYAGFTNNAKKPQSSHNSQQTQQTVSEKPMIPVPVITLTEQKLSTLQPTITESPVFQMLSVIPVGATESAHKKGQTDVVRVPSATEGSKQDEQFVELILSEVPKDTASEFPASTKPTSLGNETDQAIYYLITTPATSSGSIVKETVTKSEPSKMNINGQTNATYILISSKNNTGSSEDLSLMSAGIMKGSQINGMRDEITLQTNATTLEPLSHASPKEPMGAINEVASPSTVLASTSMIKPTIGSTLPHANRVKDSPMITKTSSSSYTDNHVNSQSTESLIPMEPLPTQLVDSLSSVMSQVSELVPPVLSLSPTSNGVPQMPQIMNINYDQRHSNISDSDKIDASINTDYQQQDQSTSHGTNEKKVTEHLATGSPATYVAVETKITKAPSQDITVRIVDSPTTQRSTTIAVNVGIASANSQITATTSTASTVKVTDSNAATTSAALNVASLNDTMTSGSTMQSSNSAQLEKTQDSSLEKGQKIKTPATDVALDTLVPEVLQSTVASSESSSTKSTLTNEYLDNALTNANWSNPVSVVDQIMNVAPLPSNTPLIESIALPNDSSMLTANALASSLIAGFATSTSERSPVEQGLAKNVTSMQNAHATVATSNVTKLGSIENVTEMYKKNITRVQATTQGPILVNSAETDAASNDASQSVKLKSDNEKMENSTKGSLPLSPNRFANVSDELKHKLAENISAEAVIAQQLPTVNDTQSNINKIYIDSNQTKKGVKEKIKTTEAPIASTTVNPVKVALVDSVNTNDRNSVDVSGHVKDSSKVETLNEDNGSSNILSATKEVIKVHFANESKSELHKNSSDAIKDSIASNATNATNLPDGNSAKPEQFAQNSNRVNNTAVYANKDANAPTTSHTASNNYTTVVTSRTPVQNNKGNDESISSSSLSAQEDATDSFVIKDATQTILSSDTSGNKEQSSQAIFVNGTDNKSSANDTSNQNNKYTISQQDMSMENASSSSESSVKNTPHDQSNETDKPASLKHSETSSKPEVIQSTLPPTVSIRQTTRPTISHKPLDKFNASKIGTDASMDNKWTLISQQIPSVKPAKPMKIPSKKPIGSIQPSNVDENNNVRFPGVETTTHQQNESSAQFVLPLEASQSANGLDITTRYTSADIVNFAKLCNELALNFWVATNKGLSTARSLALSPFGMTSLLSMIFLGARGPTSDQMNEILRLDDVATFNPHLVFQNITDTVSLARTGQGIANAAFVRELFADKLKVRKVMPFYKEQAQQFYEGLVAEVNFATISDLVRRRTNLLIRKQTGGRIKDFVKTNTVPLRSPLAALSANVFQTDCNTTLTSSVGRDGELYFAVSPAVRQRKLVPVPATTWRSGVLAGYEPSIDATAVALGGNDKLVSTIFVLPGQQGHTAPGDTLDRFEQRFVRSAFRDGTWNKLLKVLIPRSGLELQIPKFSHRSVVNATAALKRMGLDEIFSSNADFKGINGVSHRLHLADVLQMNLFSTCGDENILGGRYHVETYPASPLRRNVRRQMENTDNFSEGDTLRYSSGVSSQEDHVNSFHADESHAARGEIKFHREKRQLSRSSEKPRLKLDRPFLYFVRHNPSGIILHMGRFNPRLLP